MLCCRSQEAICSLSDPWSFAFQKSNIAKLQRETVTGPLSTTCSGCDPGPSHLSVASDSMARTTQINNSNKNVEGGPASGP